MEAPLLTIQNLIELDREITTPFSLLVNSNNSNEVETIECHSILRLLPKKRLVAKASWKNRDVVIKLFLPPKSKRKHYHRELAGIQALTNHNIPTPTLLAEAKTSDNQGQLLIFDYLSKAIDLDILYNRSANNEQLSLLSNATKLIAAMHKSKLVQKDIHLNNFLAFNNSLYIIDGDQIITNSTSQQYHVKNLALFLAQLPRSNNQLRQYLYKIYCKERSWETSNFYAFEHYIKKEREKRKSHYLKKLVRNCSAFSVTRTYKQFISYNRESNSPELQTLLKNIDQFVQSGQLLKDGNSTTVVAVKINHQQFVVKRYNIKHAWHQLKRSFRKSRAWHSWINAHLLAFYSIETAKPLAMVEKRWWKIRRQAYFICEYIDGPDITSWFNQTTNQSLKDHLTRAVYSLFENMQVNQLYHGDCKSSNFIVNNDQLYIIDLDAMREINHPKQYKQAHLKDIQRFLKNWNADANLASGFTALVKTVDNSTYFKP